LGGGDDICIKDEVVAKKKKSAKQFKKERARAKELAAQGPRRSWLVNAFLGVGDIAAWMGFGAWVFISKDVFLAPILIWGAFGWGASRFLWMLHGVMPVPAKIPAEVDPEQGEDFDGDNGAEGYGSEDLNFPARDERVSSLGVY